MLICISDHIWVAKGKMVANITKDYVEKNEQFQLDLSL